ncbi:RDD family protein [Legionella impletisoli]|uniref:RDD family protein n=1 Tax=Legionella impletisoli TaxID=343510 RepID=UPI00104192EA|nr:RDD family protein [Legionella impletisoli]
MPRLKFAFWVRWSCAFIYDIVIVLTLFLFYTFVCLLFRHGQAIAPGTLWYQGSLLSVFYAYYFFSYRYGGQTIGLKLWKMKLISTRGRLTPGEVLLRLLMFLPSIVLSICFLKRINELTDQFSGTRLIRVK